MDSVALTLLVSNFSVVTFQWDAGEMLYLMVRQILRNHNVVESKISIRQTQYAELAINHAANIVLAVTAQKMKFSIKDFFSKCDQIGTADLATFTEEIRNGNFILCVVIQTEQDDSTCWNFMSKNWTCQKLKSTKVMVRSKIYLLKNHHRKFNIEI